MAAAPALSGLVRRGKKGPGPEGGPPAPPPRSASLEARPPPPPPWPRDLRTGTSPGKTEIPGSSPRSVGKTEIPGSSPRSVGKTEIPGISPRSVPPQAPAGDASSTSTLSVMDGIPFTLHPKFESSLNPSKRVVATGVTVKSLADIDREYDYTFVVERTAAARLIS